MKDIREIINIDNLINYIGFANTPTYLYKHFKLDDSIANLSKEYSVQELKDTFMSYIDKDGKNLTDVAILYSCIFALILKPVDDVYDIMKAMQFAPLRWADKISSLYLSSISFDIEENIQLNEDNMNFSFEKNNSTEII